MAFSLVEVMVATAIFGISVLSAFGLLVQQARMAQRTQDRVYVDQVLQSRLEWMRDQPFANVAAMPAMQYLPPIPPDPDAGSAYQRPLHNAKLKMTVTPLQADLYRVDFSYAWTIDPNANSQKLTMELSTYVAQNGVHKESTQ